MTYQHTIKVADTPEVLNEIRTRIKWFQNRGQIIADGDGLTLNFDGDKDGLITFLKKKYPKATVIPL